MPIAQPNPSVMPSDPFSRAPGVLRLMCDPRVVWSAMKVSMVAGTMLNVINNGEQFWTHRTVNLWLVALNFVVPFCVSCYSAGRNEAQRARGD